MKTYLFALITALGLASAASAATEKALLAGGCFWCMESNYESVAGVSGVVSGYTGGPEQNPTYEQVSSETTGHYEAVEVTFDPAVVSYAEIMRLFFRSIDPTDAEGQFCDRGPSYRSAVFVSNTAQKAIAEAAKAEAEAALGRQIVTPILNAGAFWPAEEYHQDYYKGGSLVLTRGGPKKQSNAYKFYREGCGRDARVRQLWGDQTAFAH
ncbi:peptide-methionine (S)-S-oxide reductase MsrA [Rhodobacter ferrooxidans]|uniref:Peptide methionine sulfoxide reductase MsrA n=1 Tax=Rhodobacter ferrooxidans TaxID=371731 RepID=C8S139_9RHOB|nr:peptide-methionine (S)-S-oxide reductase MsrA [Rhodobacter sp. SW2]EEW25237.1 peptide methionine sulfoxide reductase [Rhodobacter sp. SW2]